MLKIEIRKATVKDLDGILRLNFELFKKEYREYDKTLDLDWTQRGGEKYFRNRIAKSDGFVAVAESGGKLVGYLCGGMPKMEAHRIKMKHAELENMFVDKRFRRQGVGKKLAEEFLNWCRENKADYVSVSASYENEEGIHFYRKLGFENYEIVLEMKV